MPVPTRSIKHIALVAVLSALAIALAACAGGAGGAPSPASGGTVAVQDVDGRSVVVNAGGLALYASNEERASGRVLCVSGGCLAFWKPLTIEGGTPAGDVAAGTLGVVARPDGARQVTFNGAPLYTFAPDSVGQIKGDGLADSFGGQTLTWHVVATDESPSSANDGGRYGY